MTMSLFPNNSSAALFFPPLRRRSLSSPSSSAFSSQHFTQSDTEAEEEKKYRQRGKAPQQRREVLTPTALMMGRRRGGADLLASCSTPKSSQEDLLLLENTSVYFRPRCVPHNNRPWKSKGCPQQLAQVTRISDFYPTRRRNPMASGRRGGAEELGGGRGQGRTPTQLRKRGQKGRRRQENPREEGECEGAEEQREAEEKCSSPILLDFFRRTPTEGKENESPSPEGNSSGERLRGERSSPRAHKSSFRWSPPLFSPFGRHYALLKMAKMKKKDERGMMMKRKEAEGRDGEEEEEEEEQEKYTNLPWGAARNSNSDSGMEERVEDDDDRTQFVNISAVEKVYENLPPLAPKPQPPSAQIPANPPPGIVGTLPQQIVEDFPALYARLVALAFWDAKQNGKNGGGGEQHIQLAQKQMAELVGIKLGKFTQLRADGDESDEGFGRKCAEFCSQLAQKLRNTEGHSRKEFGWQTKKLEKILHQLRTEGAGTGAQGGTLHRLIRRIFRK